MRKPFFFLFWLGFIIVIVLYFFVFLVNSSMHVVSGIEIGKVKLPKRINSIQLTGIISYVVS